jgi:uncharacterized protein YkwD
MNFFRHLRDTFVPSETNHYRPHALSRKSITLFGGLILTMKVLALFSISAIPVGQAYSSAVTPSNIIELTNQSRAGSNLTPLTESSALDAAAQNKANDMLAKQYFAHVSPSGETPWDFIANAKYNYIIAGENLAINYFTAEGVEQAWMNSPGHRANILNSNFENIGIGVSQGQYQGFPAIFVVQMFGTPLPQNYTTQPASALSVPAAAPAAQTSSSDGSATSLQGTNPQATSAVPSTTIENGSITVHATTSSSLDVPTLNQPTKVLISGDSAIVSGTANTEDVYIYVNDKAQAEYPVINGAFSAPVNLDPGNNAITAVGYNGTNIISQSSVPIAMITAMAAPEVLSAQVTPIPGDGGSSLTYQIVVHTAPSVAEVIANYGNGAVMLQPTATAGVWQAALQPDLSTSNAALVVQAYDMAGNTANSSQITFSSSIADNYAFNAPAVTHTIPILGMNVSANALNNFYVYLSLVLLVILGIAIASKISTADVAMVAQVSGLVAISIIFWAH